MKGISGPANIQTKQLRIAQLAKEDDKRVLTSLAYNMDVHWLYEAYVRTNKSSAPGIDGVFAKRYEGNLVENLKDLLERAKSGSYKTPAVKRVHIPKGEGKTRPIGLPTFEDKVLQRGVQMLLEPAYEQDFLDCSYGFRPGKSQHQALDTLWKHLMKQQGEWVLSVDISGFFDNIDHKHMRHFLDRRVRDGVVRRLIDKWLRAGICENGVIRHPIKGTPQGGVLSPLLSNIYLHELVDKWFVETVTPRMTGAARMFRFADDIIMVFQSKEDADRVLEVLHKRFEKYGLDLHPEKTRLINFQKPRQRPPSDRRPETQGNSFDFLGFTMYWRKSRKGRWVVGQKTRKSRLKRALGAIQEWCRLNRHRKLAEQHRMLALKMKGHYAYYGITGNSRMLGRFCWNCKFIWWKWLNRRSQHRHLSVKRFFEKLDRNPLPNPRIVHSVYQTQ